MGEFAPLPSSSLSHHDPKSTPFPVVDDIDKNEDDLPAERPG